MWEWLNRRSYKTNPKRNEMAESSADVRNLYFPEEHCRSCFSELSLWTSVGDCLAAARFIEKRPLKRDNFDSRLVTPFIDDEGFHLVFTQCMDWLISTYQAPETKLKLAHLMDPSIKPKTLQILLDARFKPNVSAGPAGTIARVAPGLAHLVDSRYFLVEDKPYVIELVQNPIRCIMNVMSRAWPTAQRMFKMMQDSVKETGKPPTVFHQPYTDGPLFALVEALVFYVHGLSLGPIGFEHASGLNFGYRSVEIIARPPVDTKQMEIAQEMHERMFQSLV